MSHLPEEQRPFGKITERELQVLREIASGKTLPIIGRTLGISQNTVKNHVRNIIEKLKFFHGGDLA